VKRKITANEDLVLKGFGLKKALSKGESLVLNDDDWDTYVTAVRGFISSGGVFYQEVDDSHPDGEASSTADIKTKHNSLLVDLDGDTGTADVDHEDKHKI